MPGKSDDVTVPRGVVRPPPSDSPDSVDVPRMEPPPPSLEAMVQSTQRDERRREPSGGWLVWVVLLALAAGITAYVAR